MRLRPSPWPIAALALSGCLTEFDEDLLPRPDGGSPDGGIDAAPAGPCTCGSPACTAECNDESAIGDGCSCTLDCPLAAPCRPTCEGGTRCDVLCHVSPCTLECSAGSTCDVDCDSQTCDAVVESSTLTGICKAGGACTATCTDGASCSIECRGSDCTLDCDASSTCEFTFCSGGETECPDGRVVCRGSC